MQPESINILNTILVIGAVQGFLFNIIAFAKNKLSDKTILFLNLTVFFLSANNLQAWLINKQLISSYFYIKYLHVPWYFFLIPMFYLFLINYLKIKKEYKKFLVFSIVLFVLALIIRGIALVYLDYNNYNQTYVDKFMGTYNLIEEIIIFTYTIPIFIYAIFIVFTYKKELLFILDFDNLNWIKFFLFFSVGLVLLWIVALYKSYELTTFNPSEYYNPIKIATSLLIYWLGYQGMYQQRFVKERILIKNLLKTQVGIEENISELIEGEKDNGKKHQNTFAQIDAYIVNNKRFTDTTLSLESLASELNIGTSFLSSLINTYSKSNFTDYINKLRVVQAKALLAQKKYKNYTVLAIGFESGFNSKSTFYTAFKKFTGKTPVAFKKECLSANSDGL